MKGFQSSPAALSRCNPRPADSAGVSPGRFQSSPAALSRCNPPAHAEQFRRLREVSILTGCPQPVQQILSMEIMPDHVHLVSILTGCPQPVQPPRRSPTICVSPCFNPHRLPSAGATGWGRSGRWSSSACFNPHRLPSAGATRCRGDAHVVVVLEFQSSPAALSRCNAMPKTGIWRALCQFQSSPAALSRCNTNWCDRYDTYNREFQSSPAALSRCNGPNTLPDAAESGFNPHRLPSAGATPGRPPSKRRGLWVSILTGCPQPVQPGIGGTERQSTVTWFQSSPAALSRCKHAAERLHLTFTRGFNPHRLPSAGATRTRRRRTGKCLRRFNPHRLPSAGATRSGHVRPPHYRVSILTGCPQPVQRSEAGGADTLQGLLESFNPHRLPSAGATRSGGAPRRTRWAGPRRG